MEKLRYDFAEATFMPFRLPSRFGLKLSAWYALIGLVLMALLIPVGISITKKFIPIAIALDENPESIEALNEFMALYSSMMASYLLLMICGLMLAASFSAAFLRKVFRPEQKQGFFPLRFGMEEIRVLGAKFITGLIIFGAFFVVYILTIILVVVGVTMMESNPAIGKILMALGTLTLIAGFIVMIFVGIRLSPAASLSVRDQKFRLFEAWRVTQGRIWPMIGSYIVAYLVFIVPIMLLSFVMLLGPVMASGGFEVFAQLESSANPQAAMTDLIDRLMRPGSVIAFLVSAGLYMFAAALLQFCFAGVPAYVTTLWARENNVEPSTAPYPPSASKKAL